MEAGEGEDEDQAIVAGYMGLVSFKSIRRNGGLVSDQVSNLEDGSGGCAPVGADAGVLGFFLRKEWLRVRFGLVVEEDVEDEACSGEGTSGVPDW